MQEYYWYITAGLMVLSFIGGKIAGYLELSQDIKDTIDKM